MGDFKHCNCFKFKTSQFLAQTSKKILQLFYAQNKVVQNGSDSNHLQNSDIIKDI